MLLCLLFTAVGSEEIQFSDLTSVTDTSYGMVSGGGQCWYDGNNGNVCDGSEDQVWLCHDARWSGGGYSMNSRCAADKEVKSAKDCYNMLVKKYDACSTTFSWYDNNGFNACWCITKSATSYETYQSSSETSYHYIPKMQFSDLSPMIDTSFGMVSGGGQCWYDGNNGNVCDGSEDQVWLCHDARWSGGGYSMNSRCAADKKVKSAEDCYNMLVKKYDACSSTFSWYDNNGFNACWCITESAASYETHYSTGTTSYRYSERRYVWGPNEGNCPDGTTIDNVEECNIAHGSVLYLDPVWVTWTGSDSGLPGGCSYKHFNTNLNTVNTRKNLRPICKSDKRESVEQRRQQTTFAILSEITLVRSLALFGIVATICAATNVAFSKKTEYQTIEKV